MRQLTATSSRHYDLHSHTTASDGLLTPSELILEAKERGVSHISITDHDTTDGLAEAKSAAKRIGGIEVISGVEISCCWGSLDIHMVALDIDETNPELIELLTLQQEKRYQRALKIGDKLGKLGYPNCFEQASQLANNQTPSRPHFAQALLNQGACKTFQKAFSRYLGQGKPAYCKIEWVSMAESINVIHSAAGLAVLAHPYQYKCTISKVRRLIADFKLHGGDAIEVSTSSQTHDQITQLATLAQTHDLYASVGSDYHGHASSWHQLGKYPPLPAKCRPIWELL